MNHPEPVLAAQALTVHSAGGELLVEPFSAALQAGEVLCLLGESGSGKSLLAQAWMGSLPAGLQAGGRVGLLGVWQPAAADRRADWGHRLALLPQEPWAALDPTMRVLGQVQESHALVRGLPWHQARQAALSDLDGLGLADAAQRYPFQVSGGMAQRVALAATRAAAAPVWMVDEPTKGLDAHWRAQTVALLQAEQRRGTALVVITHDVDVARALGGQVAVMRRAQVLEHGPADQVLNHPQHPYTQRLLDAAPARWPAPPPPPPRSEAAPLLQARGLGLQRGGRWLFRGLDLVLRPGERVAITGPSGAGKTSLGQVLLGLQAPDEGRVERGPGLGRHGFQKLYQDPLAAFAPACSLGQSLQDLLRLHGLAPAALDQGLQRLGLAPALLQRRPHQLSGGELQRLALLRLLLLKPAVVFADEPSSRLDTLTQRDTLALLTEMLEEQGSALLLVSHDSALASRLTERQVPVGV
jgi:peptide/nickel transport system ATP-binding protein